MTIADPKTTSFLTTLPFFTGLGDADMDRILRDAEFKKYAKSHVLFNAGDKATRFFVILQGWIKLYRMTKEGEESVLAIFARGDVFGEAAIFEGADYPFSVQIAEEAQLLEIPATTLRTMARENPDITNRIMASMSREMHKLQMENEHLAIMTAPQRVGCLMIQLSSNMLGKGGTFTFPYDKSLAAARLGMKPETFSRALSQLKPYGVLVRGNEIHIESFDALTGYICGHCSRTDDHCRGSRECEQRCTGTCGTKG